MSTYTLKLFNTGQVTLPKRWRDKFNTKLFLAKETKKGLLIEPIIDKKGKKDIVFYEDKEGVGIYCESGIPIEKIIKAIKEIDGEN